MQNKTRDPEWKRLEKATVEWLKRSGFKVQTGQAAAAKGVNLGAGVHVHFEPDALAVRERPLAWIAGLGGILGTLVMLVTLIVMHEKQLDDDLPAWLFGSLGPALLFLGFVGARNKTQYVWVECKRVREGVNAEHVRDLKGKVDEFRSGNVVSLWKPTTVYLVSGTGFEATALVRAKRHGFKCFNEVGTEEEKRSGGSRFEPV
ncbi:MAG: hypothetical protein ACRELB_04145 [Polyangiaceae bacterium]